MGGRRRVPQAFAVASGSRPHCWAQARKISPRESVSIGKRKGSAPCALEVKGREKESRARPISSLPFAFSGFPFPPPFPSSLSFFSLPSAPVKTDVFRKCGRPGRNASPSRHGPRVPRSLSRQGIQPHLDCFFFLLGMIARPLTRVPTLTLYLSSAAHSVWQLDLPLRATHSAHVEAQRDPQASVQRGAGHLASAAPHHKGPPMH